MISRVSLANPFVSKLCKPAVTSFKSEPTEDTQTTKISEVNVADCFEQNKEGGPLPFRFGPDGRSNATEDCNSSVSQTGRG
jgi:hypothetical protein